MLLYTSHYFLYSDKLKIHRLQKMGACVRVCVCVCTEFGIFAKKKKKDPATAELQAGWVDKQDQWVPFGF